MLITEARSRVASAARWGTLEELLAARQEFAYTKMKLQIEEAYPMTLEQRRDLANRLVPEDDLL